MSLLGVDIGTSKCKGVAFSQEGQIITLSEKPYERKHPETGWEELDPFDVWMGVKYVIREVFSKTLADPIEAISFSGFGGGIFPVDRDLCPLHNIIMTTDLRATEEAHMWEEHFGKERTYGITGIPVHSSFAMVKIMWFARKRPDIFNKTYKFLSPLEYVICMLGCEPSIDYSMASTTMGLDLKNLSWSKEILEFVGINENMLPTLVAPGSLIGCVDMSKVYEQAKTPSFVKVISGGHDQQVCALGAGVTEQGVGANSLGTVDCLTVVFNNLDIMSNPVMLENNYSCTYHVVKNKYVSLAYNYCRGDLFNWYIRQYYDKDRRSVRSILGELFEKMPSKPADIFVLPHFSGSGTPYLDSSSVGAVIGLTLYSTRMDIFRAIVDSINYEMKLNIELLRSLNIPLESIRCYGGGAQSDLDLQIKADMFNVEVSRLNIIEAGSLGAAVLAGIGSGIINDPKVFLKNILKNEKTFYPDFRMVDFYNHKFLRYKRVYRNIKNIYAL